MLFLTNELIYKPKKNRNSSTFSCITLTRQLLNC